MRWEGEAVPPPRRIGPAGWARFGLKVAAMGVVTFGGLVLLLLLRLVEKPLFGPRRPVTPWVTQAVCRIDLLIIGIGYRVSGRPMGGKGAVVANHAGWLDILTLNACQRIVFVAKAEVARWPGIGWLARATGTHFIARDPRLADAQRRELEDRLAAGHRLLFFPEGTSTDGRRILPFKTALFEAFLSDGLRHGIAVQPVSVTYTAPPGEDARFYGWWADMDFASHLIQILSAPRQGRVEVALHDPLQAANYDSRKALAQAAEAAVRAAFGGAVPEAPSRNLREI